MLVLSEFYLMSPSWSSWLGWQQGLTFAKEVVRIGIQVPARPLLHLHHPLQVWRLHVRQFLKALQPRQSVRHHR